MNYKYSKDWYLNNPCRNIMIRANVNWLLCLHKGWACAPRDNLRAGDGAGQEGRHVGQHEREHTEATGTQLHSLSCWCLTYKHILKRHCSSFMCKTEMPIFVNPNAGTKKIVSEENLQLLYYSQLNAIDPAQ